MTHLSPHQKKEASLEKTSEEPSLNQRKGPYLKIWEIDFTSHETREKYASLRDITKEKTLETEITALLRTKFAFRVIAFTCQAQRMGKTGLESVLIDTLARCPHCKPSTNWLGKYSPKPQIANGKLWLIQHLDANPINQQDRNIILKAIVATKLQTQKKNKTAKNVNTLLYTQLITGRKRRTTHLQSR